MEMFEYIVCMHVLINQPLLQGIVILSQIETIKLYYNLIQNNH